MAPEIGSQRTIERPDSVSRVMPPTTTIRKTSPAMNRSQEDRAAGRGTAKVRAACGACAWDAIAAPIWTRRAEIPTSGSGGHSSRRGALAGDVFLLLQSNGLPRLPAPVVVGTLLILFLLGWL
jgi:hypothetical protein